MFIPDLDLDFLPIPEPGVKKAPYPGSATLIVSGSDLHDPDPVTYLNVGPDPAFANTPE
jgi:hypothetical protein